MASNQLLKKDLREVYIKELGIRLWSAFLGKFPVALHLINELPLLNRVGVQRPQRKIWQEPKRGLHTPVEHHLFGSHQVPAEGRAERRPPGQVQHALPGKAAVARGENAVPRSSFYFLPQQGQVFPVPPLALPLLLLAPML